MGSKIQSGSSLGAEDSQPSACEIDDENRFYLRQNLSNQLLQSFVNIVRPFEVLSGLPLPRLQIRFWKDHKLWSQTRWRQKYKEFLKTKFCEINLSQRGDGVLQRTFCPV